MSKLVDWIPMQAEWWEVLRESLVRPWPAEAAYFDARWEIDQHGETSTRRVLAARWGWSDGEVRGLLRKAGRWWDSGKGPVPDLAAPRPPSKPRDPTGPTVHQEGPTVHQEGPNGTQCDTVLPYEYGAWDPEGPDMHQTGPEGTHGDPDVTTRAGVVHTTLTPHSHHTTEEDVGRAPPSLLPFVERAVERGLLEPSARAALDASDGADDDPSSRARRDSSADTTVFDATSLAYLQAATYFGEVVHRAIGRRPSHGPARDTKAGKRLWAEVKRDPELVLDALRFVGESQTQRAVDLRAYDGLTIETVLRHLPEYAELWRTHEDRAPPVRSTGARLVRAHAGDGVLDRLAASILAKKKATEGGE